MKKVKVTKRQLKKIVESMVKNPTSPRVGDFFDNLDMRRNLPSGIIHVDPSAISALRSGDTTIQEAFAKLHEYTKIEMQSNAIFQTICDAVIRLRFIGTRTPYLIPNVYTSNYQSMHAAPAPATLQDLLNVSNLHANPPGAISNYTYPGLNTISNNLSSHDLAMQMYIDKANANPTDVYYAIQNAQEHQLSKADRVEVGFAGFLAATPGVSEVTHTAQDLGVDNTALIGSDFLKFEQKKSESRDPNRNYNTTPVYNQTDKFYAFICADRGYLIRSDILAVFEKITIPIDKIDKKLRGRRVPVSPENISADAQLLSPTPQLKVDATGTDILAVIESVANSHTPLSNWWLQKIENLGDTNRYQPSQINTLSGSALAGLVNAYQTHMRALVLSIGIQNNLNLYAADLPNLTGAQIRQIVSRLDTINQKILELATAPRHLSKKQQFLGPSGNPYGITSSDSDEVIAFAMAYYNIVNNNIFGLSGTDFKSTKGQKMRLGEPEGVTASTSGASEFRTTVGDERAKSDQELLTILTRTDIPNIDKSIVIGKIVRKISKSSNETVYGQVTANPVKKEVIDNAICDLLKGEIQSFDLEKNYAAIDTGDYDFYSQYPILSRFAAAFGARRNKQHHATLKEIAENCLTPEQLRVITMVTRLGNIYVPEPEQDYDYIPAGLPFDDDDNDFSFFDFGERGFLGESVYESILLDLMEAAAKKQRSAQQSKKIKITKRQLNKLIETSLKKSINESVNKTLEGMLLSEDDFQVMQAIELLTPLLEEAVEARDSSRVMSLTMPVFKEFFKLNHELSNQRNIMSRYPDKRKEMARQKEAYYDYYDNNPSEMRQHYGSVEYPYEHLWAREEKEINANEVKTQSEINKLLEKYELFKEYLDISQAYHKYNPYLLDY